MRAGKNYSFRIAARGLSLIALKDGRNPATIPMIIANTTETPGNQNGIEQIVEIPIFAPIPDDTNKRLMTTHKMALKPTPMTPPIKPIKPASNKNIA